MSAPLTNWSKNHSYRAERIVPVRTVEEVQELVAANERIRALGTRHTFNDIGDGPGVLLSMSSLEPVFELDLSRDRSITIDGGVNYGSLCEKLDARGLALPNLASLPHISVAGACSTGTHGSGVSHGCLSTS